MRRRPTKRAFVIAGIGTLLILAGITAQAGWLFVLAAGVLGLVAGSFVVRHRLGVLVIDRTAPRRVRVGDLVRVGLTIENSSSVAVPLFLLHDRFSAFAPVSVGVDRLGPGESAEVETVREALTRGLFKAGTVEAVSGAPFGLARSRKHFPIDSDLLVVPRWVDLRSFPLVEPSSSPSDVSHERPRAGAGDEFLGVREFRPGDPLRAVHWRSTARAGTLVVREFEQEISNRTAIVLAGPSHGEGPTASFEMLVSACASIGLYALSTGHPVHLASHGEGGAEHLVDPSRDGLLDRLATVQPADVPLEPLVEAALDRIGRRGTVVICASDAGKTGSSISNAIARVERSGARAILVVARASSWDEMPRTQAGSVPEGVPLRTLANDQELGVCLAG